MKSMNYFGIAVLILATVSTVPAQTSSSKLTGRAFNKGTLIAFEERYTESGPQSDADIAAQVVSFNAALARLKTSCERVHGS